MTISAFAESTEGLIAACGALMTGLAAMLNSFERLRGQWRPRHRGPAVDTPRALTFNRPMAALGILLMAASAAMLAIRGLSTTAQGLNVELTTAAWEAFNEGDFTGAIANADKCITEFKGSADRQQAELEKSRAPIPPTGAVSKEVRETILSRGLLNDVATCFYIRGRSAENLKRRDDARDAYLSASKYSYARCWDPKGWFWSPAEVSQDRLAALK